MVYVRTSVRMCVHAWGLLMKACTLMFMVFNGHHGGSLSTSFCEGFEEILHYGMMRCLMSDVCVSVIACHLLLGIPRLSKFGKCDPWQILRIYFFQKFKISKIGFLANFFTFFLKNGAVFLWTHVQSWNCGEIMRGCLMKCIFFGRFSKISKLDFWRFFLWKSRESLVSNEITTRFLNQSEKFTD